MKKKTKNSNLDLSKKEMRECHTCHKYFMVYKSHKTKNCEACLAKDYSKTCEYCGNIFHKPKNIPLETFERMKFCPGGDCAANYSENNIQAYKYKDSIYGSIIQDHHSLKKPNIHPDDLEEVIAENCAYFRLYELYEMLIPYYNEALTGVKFDNLLPSTQTYLLDILRRIRNLNELLRIEPDRIPVGQTHSKKGGDWETGPTDYELMELELTTK